jgi:O-antigen/teichoic acid export membrane protein
MTSDTRRTASKAQAARGRHRGPKRAEGGPVRRIAGESLVRNSGFLVMNVIFSAACGYAALGLLTRLYSVPDVGLSATALSAGSLIVFVMQFGINYSLPRFLPVSKDRAALINTALTATLLASVVGSVVFLLLPVADKLYALGGGLFALVFLVATFAQAGEAGLGTVLIADRSSGSLAAANFVPNLIKLAAPLACTFLGALGAYAARIASDLVGVCIFATVVARRGHRFRPALNATATRELRRFSLGMYVASLLGSLPLMLLPIIILVRFGKYQAAYWSVAITMASLLYQLPSMIGQALLPEVARQPSQRRHLVRRSATMVGAIVVPVLVIEYFAAPYGLAIFGAKYVADALIPLRWLIVAGFVTVMNYAAGTILYLAKKTVAISVINAVDAVIVLGLALSWASGAQGVAISWLIGDVGNTVLFCTFALIALRQVGGRWEDLGGRDAQPESVATAFAAATATAQLRALDVLLSLARPQPPIPQYRPGDAESARPGDREDNTRPG